MLVDTHCHLGDQAFDADRPDVLARATANNVNHMVIVADSVDATTKAVGIATHCGASCTAGVHPHEASSWDSGTAAQIVDAIGEACVVAVGETGLDYHYDHSPRGQQRTAFEQQFALAAEHRLPVVVHARDADEDMVAMLTEWGRNVPAVVMHSFSSGRAVFDAGVEIGAYFGWSGMVTFKNWKLTDLVSECPKDRIMVETDSPYLAPVPHRGKRNEPLFVQHVARRVAEIRNVPFTHLAADTTDNAERCFGPRIRQPISTRP